MLSVFSAVGKMLMLTLTCFYYFLLLFLSARYWPKAVVEDDLRMLVKELNCRLNKCFISCLIY